MKQTALHAVHEQAGAKLVDFAGWHMPLHYGSQVEEHHIVRQHAGMFDVSHMKAIDIQGIQGKAFLQKVLANDVAKFIQSNLHDKSKYLTPGLWAEHQAFIGLVDHYRNS